ncbi:MAG: hypothetical protein LBL92_04390 [Propionibacteriaceae bacterium]|jgi:F0F1-type ATP synthase assembly protein I|nr:hypothetical protein [Propionibacteriaceae bacterium]
MSNPKSNDGDGFAALSYMLTGLLLYGSIGWAVDRWLETDFWLPIGLVVGLGLSLWLIVKRFGTST